MYIAYTHIHVYILYVYIINTRAYKKTAWLVLEHLLGEKDITKSPFKEDTDGRSWLWRSAVTYARSGKTKLWALSVLGWRQLKCKWERQEVGSSYCSWTHQWPSNCQYQPCLQSLQRGVVALTAFFLSLANLPPRSSRVGGTTRDCFWSEGE